MGIIRQEDSEDVCLVALPAPSRDGYTNKHSNMFVTRQSEIYPRLCISTCTVLIWFKWYSLVNCRSVCDWNQDFDPQKVA